MISTADDLSKFSRFLLNKGRGIFSSDVIVADMITGHVIRPVNAQIPPVLTGQTLNPDGGAYAAGYGFDTVGDVMFGEHYFDKGGDSLVCRTRNGFVPSRRLGVTLLSNAQSGGGRQSSFFVVDLMRSFVLGLFMDVPIDSLRNNFRNVVSGWTIPDKIKTILVGTYHATTSAKFYGQVEISRDGQDIKFQYGVYSGRMIATPDPTLFVVDWNRGARTTVLQVLGLNESKPQIPFTQSLIFTKD
ncbi:hypothetical protein AeNC1_018662 [Aphanomyces euteiches]|nr:hypothetical protein AeNC1_018662 [Aphanomyces euteiches]